MSTDVDDIKAEILKRLKKRQIKPFDLANELATHFSLGDDKAMCWDAIKKLEGENLVHKEVYLAIGASPQDKRVDPEVVKELKEKIVEALTSDDYQSQRTLQDSLGADFPNFRAAKDELTKEGKVKPTNDPNLGWLLHLVSSSSSTPASAKGRTVTQPAAFTGKPTPSSPKKGGAVEDPF